MWVRVLRGIWVYADTAAAACRHRRALRIHARWHGGHLWPQKFKNKKLDSKSRRSTFDYLSGRPSKQGELCNRDNFPFLWAELDAMLGGGGGSSIHPVSWPASYFSGDKKTRQNKYCGLFSFYMNKKQEVIYDAQRSPFYLHSNAFWVNYIPVDRLFLCKLNSAWIGHYLMFSPLIWKGAHWQRRMEKRLSFLVANVYTMLASELMLLALKLVKMDLE